MTRILAWRDHPARDPGTTPRIDSRDVCLAAILLLLILAVYAPVRHFDFVNYDDLNYVPFNAHVMSGLSADNLRWAFTHVDENWMPLTWISLMADRQFFGPPEDVRGTAVRAAPYHLTNVMLHAASTLLLFLLFKRMTGASGPSAVVAFLFALHPQHVESVAWVAERKDVLSALFWMLALWSYVRYAARPKTATYLPTLLLYCLGFMAKPMVVTLPLVLVLLDVWPLRRFPLPARGTGGARGPLVRRLVLEKLPFFVLALVMSAVTYAAQRSGGAVRTFDDVPLGARLGNALLSGAVYIGKTVWPTHLAIFYPLLTKVPVWQLMVAGLLLAGMTVLTLRSVRTRPYLAVGWFWYLITVLPVIGIIQVGAQARADRYTYIPMIGLSLMFAWSLADVWLRWPRLRPVLAGLCAAACVACLAVTWRQVSYWENGVTLFRHAIEVTPPNANAHWCLGKEWQQELMYDEAIAEYHKALAINPREVGAMVDLGRVLAREGHIDETIDLWTAAVRLKPHDPEAHNGLGQLLASEGHPNEALAEFAAAIRLKPDYAEAQVSRGNVLLDLGRIDQAIDCFSKALRTDPGSPSARQGLQEALSARERR